MQCQRIGHEALVHRVRRAALVALASATLCAAASKASAEPQRESPYRRLEIFARALAHVEQSYVGEADPDELIYGAIRGMLQVLDPHSAFLDPSQVEILTSDAEGRYAGIGVEIDVRDGWLTVVSVFDGGPAQRAGIEPGDRFLSIDGAGARDMPIERAQQSMRGAPGTTVHATLRRPGEDDALSVELTRELIEVRAVDARVLPDGTLYVQLKLFQETTASELRRALDRASEHAAGTGGLRGVLLDLRDNPGGLLRGAVLVADEFLAEGVIVSTRGRDGVLQREYRASSAGTRPSWPMVVLINGYSASAAEIVAGALADHGRAVVAGTRSFGKGSVQNVIDLPDDSALKLTTALYYTPNGRSIQAEGIEPDVVLPQLEAPQLASASDPAPSEAELSGHLEQEDPRAPAPALPRGAVRGPDPLGERRSSSGIAGDFQAHMAHQVLRALIAQTDR